MTCGTCGGGASVRTRLGMCAACEYADEPGPMGPVACTIDGKALVGRPSCPEGRHPDPDGIVVWMGLRWRGVPFPLRVYLWIRTPTHPRPRSFPGCGCIDRLKKLLKS